MLSSNAAVVSGLHADAGPSAWERRRGGNCHEKVLEFNKVFGAVHRLRSPLHSSSDVDRICDTLRLFLKLVPTSTMWLRIRLNRYFSAIKKLRHFALAFTHKRQLLLDAMLVRWNKDEKERRTELREKIKHAKQYEALTLKDLMAEYITYNVAQATKIVAIRELYTERKTAFLRKLSKWMGKWKKLVAAKKETIRKLVDMQSLPVHLRDEPVIQQLHLKLEFLQGKLVEASTTEPKFNFNAETVTIEDMIACSDRVASKVRQIQTENNELSPTQSWRQTTPPTGGGAPHLRSVSFAAALVSSPSATNQGGGQVQANESNANVEESNTNASTTKTASDNAGEAAGSHRPLRMRPTPLSQSLIKPQGLPQVGSPQNQAQSAETNLGASSPIITITPSNPPQSLASPSSPSSGLAANDSLTAATPLADTVATACQLFRNTISTPPTPSTPASGSWQALRGLRRLPSFSEYVRPSRDPTYTPPVLKTESGPNTPKRVASFVGSMRREQSSTSNSFGSKPSSPPTIRDTSIEEVLDPDELQLNEDLIMTSAVDSLRNRGRKSTFRQDTSEAQMRTVLFGGLLKQDNVSWDGRELLRFMQQVRIEARVARSELASSAQFNKSIAIDRPLDYFAFRHKSIRPEVYTQSPNSTFNTFSNSMSFTKSPVSGSAAHSPKRTLPIKLESLPKVKLDNSNANNEGTSIETLKDRRRFSKELVDDVQSLLPPKSGSGEKRLSRSEREERERAMASKLGAGNSSSKESLNARREKEKLEEMALPGSGQRPDSEEEIGPRITFWDANSRFLTSPTTGEAYTEAELDGMPDDMLQRVLQRASKAKANWTEVLKNMPSLEKQKKSKYSSSKHHLYDQLRKEIAEDMTKMDKEVTKDVKEKMTKEDEEERRKLSKKRGHFPGKLPNVVPLIKRSQSVSKPVRNISSAAWRKVSKKQEDPAQVAVTKLMQNIFSVGAVPTTEADYNQSMQQVLGKMGLGAVSCRPKATKIIRHEAEGDPRAKRPGLRMQPQKVAP
eukprot:TRINITY_DN54998_c0_g1_i1.p1 TRINITY_DN54998_c0_g1~~TRINITY_DN54998_c0_g1_i1.p1  ORF type:complete len:1016 (+),score=112.68 TRINITY_DN54998_c0_g1_i1:104-3151(+)